MKRITTDWKLLGGFSALLFLVIALGVVGIFQIRSLNKTIDNLGEKYFPLQRAALEMKTNNNLYVMEVRNYVFWKGSRYLEAVRAVKGIEAIQKITQDFDRQLVEYSFYIQVMFPDLEAAGRYQAWLENITGSVKKLRLIGSKIIKLVDKGVEREDINRLIMVFESQQYKVSDFLDITFEEFNLKAIKEELQLANRRAARAILFLIWSLAFGVLVGVQTAAAVYRNRRQERERREYLTRQMITTEEKERKSLSFQVHDQMGQDLSALQIYLDLAAKKILPGQEEIKKNISEGKKILSGLMRKIHNISEMLRPPIIDTLGLAEAIDGLVLQYRQAAGINFIYQKPKKIINLAAEHSLVFYRVVQEGVTNIIKHARAKTVNISLTVKKEIVCLVIHDDGIGFDYRDFLKCPHRRRDDRMKLGLLGLKERVEILGGSLEIKTAPDKGTRLTIKLST